MNRIAMAALLAMLRAVRVLAPWLDSGEIAHRSRTIDNTVRTVLSMVELLNGVPRPRRIEILCEYR